MLEKNKVHLEQMDLLQEHKEKGKVAELAKLIDRSFLNNKPRFMLTFSQDGIIDMLLSKLPIKQSRQPGLKILHKRIINETKQAVPVRFIVSRARN